MMKKEKITAIPERKKDTYLTAVLSLPLRVHERAWLFTCGRSISRISFRRTSSTMLRFMQSDRHLRG